MLHLIVDMFLQLHCTHKLGSTSCSCFRSHVCFWRWCCSSFCADLPFEADESARGEAARANLSANLRTLDFANIGNVSQVLPLRWWNQTATAKSFSSMAHLRLMNEYGYLVQWNVCFTFHVNLYLIWLRVIGYIQKQWYWSAVSGKCDGNLHDW